ncbi:MAG: RHS repeat-associated core domain-containing protein [Dehalococcoidia bacterium]
MRKGGEVSYLLTDHLGATTGVLDADGNVTSLRKYWPFGAERAISGDGRATDRWYTGQKEEDFDGLGLYNYGARFYSTLTGRFLSVDPVVGRPGDPQSWNTYSYVRNNPLRRIDPSGMADMATGGNAWGCNTACQWKAAASAYQSAGANSWATGSSIAVAASGCDTACQWTLAANAYTAASWVAASQAYQAAAWVASAPATPPISTYLAEAPKDDGGSGFFSLPLVGEVGTGGLALGGGFTLAGLGAAVAPFAVPIAIAAPFALIPNDTGPARPVVIGENMGERVIPASAALGAQNYFGPTEEQLGGTMHASALNVNRQWIQAMIRQGRVIYDIGIDENRRGGRSEFYAMEKAELAAAVYPVEQVYWPPGSGR